MGFFFPQFPGKDYAIRRGPSLKKPVGEVMVEVNPGVGGAPGSADRRGYARRQEIGQARHATKVAGPNDIR